MATAASRRSRPDRSIARWARDHGWDAPPDADAKELADAAKPGDPVALRAFRRGAHGGRRDDRVGRRGVRPRPGRHRRGSGQGGALLFAPLRETLTWYAGLDFIRELRVVPAELGGDAGLVGAGPAGDARELSARRRAVDAVSA